MKIGLGNGFNRPEKRSNIVMKYDFSALETIPDLLTNTRSSGGWYQDSAGYFHHQPDNHTLRFGTIYGSARGALVEIAVTAYNLYSRPSSGTISDHITSGASIASIITDTETPCLNLENGDQVWQFDNIAGGTDIDIIWAGTTSSAASAIAYCATVSGDAPILSISGNGTEKRGHSVAGYHLHKIDGVAAAGNELRLTVKAGSLIRVACVNLQGNLGATSFIDTAGSVITRAGDDLNGNAPYWDGVDQGTLLFDFTIYDRDGKTGHFFEARDPAISERFTLWHTGGLSYISVEAGNVVDNRTTENNHNEQRIKTALSFKTNQFILARNGFTLFTDNAGNAPDSTAIAATNNALSFLSVNRSGAVPVNGVIHSFRLYNETLSAKKLEQITSPNSSSELWIAQFGDSNLQRWETSWGGRPQQRFEDTIKASFSNAYITNEGKSGSCTNYDAAIALGADRWSAQNDTAAGNAHNEALARNKLLTNYQLQRLDYAVINLGANDLRKIGDGTITAQDYKDSLENVIAMILQDYGEHIKFIMQYQLRSNHGDYNDADMQAVRDIQRDIAQQTPEVIGTYETYDVELSDNVHADEAGYNALAERAANIILADQGRATLVTSPIVTNAYYKQDQITINTTALSLTGSETSQFRIESDGVVQNITDVNCNSGDVTLTLAVPLTQSNNVKLWVAYGKMSSAQPTAIVKDEQSALPLSSLSGYSLLYQD